MAEDKLPYNPTSGGAGGNNNTGNTNVPKKNTSTILNALNPVNYPTKPTNDKGLKSNLPPVSLSDRPKPLIEKLEEGIEDAETIDVSNRAIDLVINVIDEVYINVPDIVKVTYPKEVRGADFVGYDVDFDISFDVTNGTSDGYVEVGIGNTKSAFKTTDKRLSLNVKDIVTNYIDIDGDVDKITIPISLTPVNGDVRGETETFKILFDKGDLNIPKDLAINRLAEGFISQFTNCDFDDSKYLTHLLHLGNGDNKVITTWVGSEDSLILKLYEPLPTSVQTNDKVFITKVQANPIVETITLVGEDVDYCPPLQGPNFSLEPDNGIGYQVYDELLASGSSTNTSLIREYTSKVGIDTEKLNIEYASGSEYLFDNFVHFGSAEERIKNFLYKIELLESYQSKYNELTTTTVELGFVLAEGIGQDGYVIITEDDKSLQLDATVVTTTSVLQANKQLDNINNLIGTFDGFEMWLYTDTEYSSSLSYPKSGNTIVASTDSEAIAWYNSAVNLASTFDRNNVDYLNNNLPEFIREDYQNEDFILFMDMLGHHFDVIWAYINALTKLKNPQHKSDRGFSNELVYSMLESLGWDGKKAYDSQFLWEYAFGQYKDGTQKYQQSLKSANEEVWRRILNNLPYLLKHKGTARSLKAVMACYGVPQSLLTIMEFGGPTDPTDGGTQPFTFDDRTAALIFSGSQQLNVDWNTSQLPLSIEMNVKLNEPQNHSLVKGVSGASTYFELDAIQTTGSFGKIVFSMYSGSGLTPSGEPQTIETNERKLFDDEYKTIAVTRADNTINSGSYTLYLKQSLNDRLVIDESSTKLISSSYWDDSTELHIGSSSYTSFDEFRLWSTPLEDGVITTHTKMPDAISGNNYTASSSELIFRLDFERVKNVNSDPYIKNVAISDVYNQTYATASGFISSSYPYNYETYERSVTAQVPSLGFNQSDKIRFEEQTLVGDLSHKVRATQKSLDRAPIDSSRLGLFFSPIKELNMDIIKSFGNFNIDNYIGAPADEYKDEYTELKSLRDYYFQRLDRDIYEYIRLVRYIDKSLFDVLEDLVPARAKVSKGLLIEPHYLERSKTKWDKPTSEKRDYETNVDVEDDVTLIGDNNQFEGNLDAEQDVVLSHQYDNYDGVVEANDDVTLDGTTPFYSSSISVDDDTTLEGTYPSYITEVEVPNGANLEATAESFGFEQIGMDPNSLNNAGFGLYAPIEKHSIVPQLDIFGNLTSSRQQVYLVKESYVETISTQTEGWPATTNNEQVKYEDVDVTKYRYKVTKVPYGESDPSVGNDVVEVTPLNGYFPSHYRYKNNLSQGLKYSFFDGSQQTADTTPDGLSPVETFTTNPNILRVADTGRGSGEPILEVD